MARTIAVALQKGGTGKTTTAEAVASILGAKGHKVLAIDMDGQANLTFVSGARIVNKTIIDVLADDINVQDVICRCKYYDLIAGDDRLVNLEAMENVDISILKDAIKPILSKYDYIVIDTPPALGNLLRISLYASDYVLVPLDAKPLAIKGLDALKPTINEVNGLQIIGIVLIRYNSRNNISRQLRGMLRMENTLCATTISEGLAVVEAQTVGQSLIDYAPKAKPTQDYYALVEELLGRLGE